MVAELQKYMGKNVRTERPATPEEAARCGSQVWGGEGIVMEIEEDEQGLIWFMIDWGMGWVITEDTEITVLG